MLQAKSAPGLRLLPAVPTLAADGTDERVRQTYRVEDAAKLGSLQWSTAPPRINVLIESQFTIHPDSAEWVAVLRYDVSGGALDSIHLKLPTTWAMKAEVEMAGGEFRRKSDPLGPFMFWTLKPNRPVWGSQRVVLHRHSRSCQARNSSFPRSPPWGRGSPIPTSALSTLRARGSRPRARVHCTRSVTPAGSRTRSLATFPEPTPGRSMSSGRTGP